MLRITCQHARTASFMMMKLTRKIDHSTKLLGKHGVAIWKTSHDKRQASNFNRTDVSSVYQKLWQIAMPGNWVRSTRTHTHIHTQSYEH